MIISFAAAYESESGTFEACWAGPMMSVVRGKPEVVSEGSKRRF